MIFSNRVIYYNYLTLNNVFVFIRRHLKKLTALQPSLNTLLTQKFYQAHHCHGFIHGFNFELRFMSRFLTQNRDYTLLQMLSEM